MNTLECIKQRKSVRSFTDKSVSEEDIKLLMEAGMSAPTGMNRQPWEFYIAKSNESKEKIRKAMPYGKYKSDVIIITCIKERQTLPFEGHDLAYCDLSAATENILLEATELGLGSVWCAIYPHKKLQEEIKKVLDLPRGITPFSAIYIGYEEGSSKPKDKFKEENYKII